MKENNNIKTVLVENDWMCTCGELNHMSMKIPFGYIKSYNKINITCQKCSKVKIYEFNFSEKEIDGFEKV